MSELSHADKQAAFKRATSCLVSWYGEKIEAGMCDEELNELLVRVLGIDGGSAGPGRINVSYKSAGLRIWASWGYYNEYTDRPIFSGQQTIDMAREIYGISDPSDDQMALL